MFRLMLEAKIMYKTDPIHSANFTSFDIADEGLAVLLQTGMVDSLVRCCVVGIYKRRGRKINARLDKELCTVSVMMKKSRKVKIGVGLV